MSPCSSARECLARGRAPASGPSDARVATRRRVRAPGRRAPACAGGCRRRLERDRQHRRRAGRDGHRASAGCRARPLRSSRDARRGHLAEVDGACAARATSRPSRLTRSAGPPSMRSCSRPFGGVGAGAARAPRRSAAATRGRSTARVEWLFISRRPPTTTTTAVAPIARPASAARRSGARRRLERPPRRPTGASSCPAGAAVARLSTAVRTWVIGPAPSCSARSSIPPAPSPSRAAWPDPSPGRRG